MKTGVLAQNGELQVIGRSPVGEDVTLFWTGSGVSFITDATDVWVELEAVYDKLDLWIEVVIDGEVSQRRALDKGKNRIHIFGGGELRTNREFKILRTTQAFFEDTVSYIKVTDIETNGEFSKVKDRPLFLEFIGDSITSGEGAALTRQNDWTPATFSCTSNYAYITAGILGADYNCISQSGFGLYAAWDADYTHVIPPHYEQVAGTLEGEANAAVGAQDDWDFGKRTVDAVILNLGTNDQSGLNCYKTEEEKAKFLEGFKKTAINFLGTLRKNNPDAYILWAYGMMGTPISSDIEDAVKEYKSLSGDERVSFFELPTCHGDEIGMRVHPTLTGHKHAAKALSAEIRRVLGLSQRRILNVMKRAMKGEELTIGFIGGSITQGSLSSTPDKCYAKRVFDWWKENFPGAKFNYVNAGIGGTDSYYGVGRCDDDLLCHDPDFVMVDFSVNDEVKSFYGETYEGLIRKLVSYKSSPAVLALYNVFYDTGVTAEDMHREICDHYFVDGISMRDTVYKDIKDGKFTSDEITPDGLHPNDKGHEEVARHITEYLDELKAKAAAGAVSGLAISAGNSSQDNNSAGQQAELPSPITFNRFENAGRTVLNKEFGTVGEVYTFEFNGSKLGVQYRKTVKRPALIAKLTVDGDTLHPIILDGNFDEDWGDCIYLEHIFTHMDPYDHIIKLEITEKEGTGSGNKTPFLLYGFYY